MCKQPEPNSRKRRTFRTHIEVNCYNRLKVYYYFIKSLCAAALAVYAYQKSFTPTSYLLTGITACIIGLRNYSLINYT